MSSTIFTEDYPMLGEFDISKNSPVCHWDPKCLVESVGILWEAFRKQRIAMEAMEKESQRRRTEMEVRLQGMHSEMTGLVTSEARKRESEDEALREEIARLKASLSEKVDEMRKEADEKQKETERYVERTTGTLKASLSDAQSQILDLQKEVDLLKEALGALRGAGDGVLPKLEELHRAINSKHAAICGFIGTTPDGVDAARTSGTEKTAFLATPALVDLASRIKTVDALTQAHSTDIDSLGRKNTELQRAVDDTKENINQVSQKLQTAETRLLDGYTDGDKKLSRRIDDLESRLMAAPKSTDRDAPVVIPDTTPAINSLRDELDALSGRVRELEVTMPTKASQEDLDTKADVDALLAIQKQIHEMSQQIQDHEVKIEELFKRPVGEGSRTVEIREVPKPSPPSAPKPDPRIDELMERVGDAERMCSGLQETKADKDDVEAMLKDLMKKIQRALNDIFIRLQALESVGVERESTAGRFRCLSCNRKAGPLQETLQERMSSGQFPPSHMYVQSVKMQRPSSAKIPGMRDYGGGMTSSRKKLMNYYSWLQDRAEEGSSPERTSEQNHVGTTATTGRPRSPSHPWDGAQSGGGAYGERQCGNHGSPEPEAIGADGKYYVGVKSTTTSRPQSAQVRIAAPEDQS